MKSDFSGQADVNGVWLDEVALEDNYRCALFEDFGLTLIQSIDQYNAHYCKDEACAECPGAPAWTTGDMA